MRRLFAAIVVWMGMLVIAGALGAQPGGDERQPGEDGRRERLSREFAAGPEVGELVPDVAAYDGEGKSLRLSSLKGSHAVLVFGCLT